MSYEPEHPSQPPKIILNARIGIIKLLHLAGFPIERLSHLVFHRILAQRGEYDEDGGSSHWRR